MPHQLAERWQKQQKACLSLQRHSTYAPKGQHKPCSLALLEGPCICSAAALLQPSNGMSTLAASHERKT